MLHEPQLEMRSEGERIQRQLLRHSVLATDRNHNDEHSSAASKRRQARGLISVANNLAELMLESATGSLDIGTSIQVANNG